MESKYGCGQFKLLTEKASYLLRDLSPEELLDSLSPFLIEYKWDRAFKKLSLNPISCLSYTILSMTM